MLTAEENRQMTQVGAGTPMGELLRRYWHPFAAVGELDEHPTKPVRLLGEDLVLYKDTSGNFGLIDRFCAHRRVDLSYGIPEPNGLRCPYHGWCYDATGQCIAQPYEETAHPGARFKDRVKMAGYPVQAKAGLLWAYLGPSPAPLVPDWEPYSWDNTFKQIVFTEVPCSWLQCQENSIDPVHFEWLHGRWLTELQGSGPPHRRHLKLGFDEFEYGFHYRRVVEGNTEQDNDWSIGRTCLWPYALFVGSKASCHFEWRVPIDDETTLSVAWFADRPAPGFQMKPQPAIPHWTSPIKDAKTGRWLTSHVMNQDFVAWVSQGAIADRTAERLGESDRGIIMMRAKLKEQMALVADGGDPIGIFRDPAGNTAVELPLYDVEARSIAGNAAQRPGGTLGSADDAVSGFPFLAGQPPEIAAAYQEVAESWNALS